jgi:hypothetical protein
MTGTLTRWDPFADMAELADMTTKVQPYQGS